MTPRERLAIERRAWRILFVCAALALTIGTHWPRLEIDLGGEPAPDKLLHSGAFGLMTLLLWTTGWIQRRRTLLIVGLAWAAIDEITQGAPGLSRTVSVHDAVASSVGVTLAVAMLWCAAPVRASRAARIVELRLAASLDRALAGSVATAAIVSVGGAGGLIGGLIGGLVGWFNAQVTTNPRPAEVALLGLGLGALIGAHFVIEIRRRRALKALVGRCLRCTTVVAIALDGWTRCAECDEPRHSLSDTLPPLPGKTLFRLGVLGGAITASVLMLMAVGLAGIVAAWARLDGFRRFSAGWTEWPPGTSFVLDLLWVGVMLAVTARLLRRMLAKRIDSQGDRCISCGHDLHATTVIGGRGQCGECGAEFVRVDPESGRRLQAS